MSLEYTSFFFFSRCIYTLFFLLVRDIKNLAERSVMLLTFLQFIKVLLVIWQTSTFYITYLKKKNHKYMTSLTNPDYDKEASP